VYGWLMLAESRAPRYLSAVVAPIHIANSLGLFGDRPSAAREMVEGAEIATDGSSNIGKPDGADGEVSIGTVTFKLIYEVDGPEHFGPEVTTRFDTIEFNWEDRTASAYTGSRDSRLLDLLEAPPPRIRGQSKYT